MSGLSSAFCGHTETKGNTTFQCIRPTGHTEGPHHLVSQDRAAAEPIPLVVEYRTRPYFPLTYGPS